MLKRFFTVLLAILMFANLLVFAELLEEDGTYREDFEGYESESDIIADKTIIKEFTKYEPALGENGESQVMVVNSATGADNTIFTNPELYNNELIVMKFKMGADSAKNQNWGSTSSLVFSHANDSGITVNDYIFDFAYSLVRHKLNGTSEKGICGFAPKKMYNIALTIKKQCREEKYYYDVTYSVDGTENKISYPTTEDGTMRIGFKSTAGNTIYVDDIEVTGFTLTRAELNIENRIDVPVIPEIKVAFSEEIDESLLIPSEIMVGDVAVESMEHIGENVYSIVLSEILKKNTEYVLDLSDIRDKNGNELAKSKFTFRTKNSAIIIDGVSVINTSSSENENILIVFSDSVLPVEIYPEEELMMWKDEFIVVTPDYRPIVATDYVQNTGKINDEFTATFDSETQMLEVSGKTESGLEDELTAVLVEDGENVVFTKILKTGEDGYFSMEFAPEFISGTYTITVKTLTEEFSSPVSIRRTADIVALLEIVNEKDAESITEALENYSSVLLIELDLYKNLEDKSFISEELVKFDEYTAIEKLVADIEVLSLIATMKASDDMYSIFKDYESLVLSSDDAEYVLWDELSESNKADVIKSAIQNKTYAPEKFQKEIYVQSIFKMIETTNKYADVKNAIETYPELLGIELEDYNKAGKPTSVAKGLCGKEWNTDNFADKFEALIKEAKKASSKPSGGGGGGGGGKTTSKAGQSGAVILPKTEPEAEDVVKAEPELPKEETKIVFSDIEDAKWAEKAIYSLAERKIINGYDDATFKPNGFITREEFISIIVRYLGLDSDAQCDFTDVAKDAWFYKSVAEAAAKGIIKGISETEFGTGFQITRQDAAVILYNIGAFKGNGKLEFSDNDEIAEYAKEAVAVLSGNGIINGVSDGVFAPVNKLTRAQAAQLIYIYDLKKGDDK